MSYVTRSNSQLSGRCRICGGSGRVGDTMCFACVPTPVEGATKIPLMEVVDGITGDIRKCMSIPKYQWQMLDTIVAYHVSKLMLELLKAWSDADTDERRETGACAHQQENE